LITFSTLKNLKVTSPGSVFHQDPRIIQEAMSIYFATIQKKKNHLMKGRTQIQRMKKEQLQGRRFIQIMAIITGTKLSFLDSVIIVKILVIKLNIAWLVRMKHQD